MTDITIFQGEDRDLSITIEDEDGNQISLNDDDVVFEVFTNNYADTATITKTKTTSSNPVSISLEDTETDIEPGTYRWTLTVELSNGTDYVAENGRINLEKTP